MPRVSRWALSALWIAIHATPLVACAQWQAPTGPRGAAVGVTVGGDVERYVRALEIAGIVSPIAWGARPFGAAELQALLGSDTTQAHPWGTSMRRALAARSTLGVSLVSSANGGFAWGANDGAMWQGRGLNGGVGLAATFRWGPFSATAAPVAYAAQNLAFPLLPQPVQGISPLADPQYPSIVDLPQRMGTGMYARLDPGESTIRVRAAGLQAGLTTASLGWGAGETFPAIFGPNAGGFPHLFLGTDGRGVRVPSLGRLSTRYILGVLQQSAWSPVQGSATYVDAVQSGIRRLGTGVTISFMPSLVPDLELGVSRFFHSPFREGPDRWKGWSKPFEGIFKKGLRATPGSGDPTGDADNQIASFFARITAPRRGVEASIEVLREDHNWDSRDFAEEPENNSAVMASIRAITHRSATNLSILTLEYFDGDVRPIAQARAQEALYVHTGMRQGHTQRGQLLGAPMGVGAVAGQRIGWERFGATSSTRLNFQRWQTRSKRFSDQQGLYPPAAVKLPFTHDWILDVSASRSRYRGGQTMTFEVGTAWAGVWNFDDRRLNPYVRGSWTMF